MIKATIHQPQYIPWPSYFDKILQSDIFVFLDDVQFQKNGLQNRNKIKTPQGAGWLTIPIKHSFGQLINEVEIDNNESKIKHLRSIQMNYKKAPYYSEIYELILSVLSKDNKFISNISMELIVKILSYMGYKGEIVNSSDFGIQSKGSKMILDLCNILDVDKYLSGIGGLNYLVREDFIKSGIEVQFQEFSLPAYNQCFNNVGFIPDLSILDLLFNEGAESVNIMKLGKKPYLSWDEAIC